MKILAGLAALVALQLAGMPSAAHAGADDVPCDAPLVFPGAAVNVVILPFAVADGLPRASAEAGVEVARAIQRETLLAIVKFGSVGSVQLASEPGRPCSPEDVEAKLTGVRPGARATLRPGGGLVLVWGRLFRQGGDIYLQTFVRFVRRGQTERVVVRVGGQPFDLRPSMQAFACVPRRLATQDLASIHEQFVRQSLLHSQPDSSSPARGLPAEGGYSYVVREARGDWMRIESPDGRLSGWMLARGDRSGWSLGRLMPELHFVEGVVGFLRDQVARAASEPASVARLDLAEAALARYGQAWREGMVAAADDPEARHQALAIGVPLQMRVLLALLHPQTEPGTVERLLPLAARARELLPWSAAARGLEAVVRLMGALSGRPDPADPAVLVEAGEAAVEALAAAVGLEPDNVAVVENLERACRVALELPRSAPTPSPGSTGAPDPARLRIERRLAGTLDLLTRLRPPR